MSEKKNKPVVRAKPIGKKSLVADYESPKYHNVVTKIVADDPMFVPKYKTEGAACVDLVANIQEDDAGKREIALNHRATVVVDCGFSMELPPGFKALISARSGFASKGLIVTNGPGVIDSDYRGRVKVILTNVGKEIIVVKHGDRIAQMSIERMFLFDWQVVDSISDTERGADGFGSTGVQ